MDLAVNDATARCPIEWEVNAGSDSPPMPVHNRQFSL
jgi:hypothetical protein